MQGNTSASCNSRICRTLLLIFASSKATLYVTAIGKSLNLFNSFGICNSLLAPYRSKARPQETNRKTWKGWRQGTQLLLAFAKQEKSALYSELAEAQLDWHPWKLRSRQKLRDRTSKIWVCTDEEAFARREFKLIAQLIFVDCFEQAFLTQSWHLWANLASSL